MTAALPPLKKYIPASHTKTRPKIKKVTKEPIRLYSRGVVLGYRRSKNNQNPSCSLIRVEGVKTREDTQFYVGKRVAYIYKGKTIKKGHKYRIVWGKLRRSHGNSGVFRAKFTKNLPPCSFGKKVRVFMYPSKI